MTETPQFTIVGSGLAGALLACYLGKAGKRVDLCEKRSDPRHHGADRGRSINLAISLRGIKALEEVGLAQRVLQNAIPMRGRMIHSRTGEQTFQPYGKDESQAINSVSRAGLNLILIEAAAQYPSVRMFFDNRCTGVDLKSMVVELDERGDEKRKPFDILIGADGAYSAVRASLQKQERFNYQQDYLSHGYKELTIPPGPNGAFPLERNALHIWPRHSFMMIALPNIDGSFTCTLFWAYDGPNSFAAIKTELDLHRFFSDQFRDAVPLLPNLADEYFYNPIGPLLTVRCLPWHMDGRVVLLGDAAHAVVPFLGQGMNAAFEDCSVLARCLQRNDAQSAFAEYEHLRKDNADALADMAIDNFLEMRDRVASRWFVLRKKSALLLYKLLPSWYVPLYNLIQFTTTPYAQALRRARLQARLVRCFGIASLLFVIAVIACLLAIRFSQ